MDTIFIKKKKEDVNTMSISNYANNLLNASRYTVDI